jgi:DNA repair exonuclease SbcCD nuclease subunit
MQLDVDAICCGGDLYEQERFSADTGAFLRAQFARVAPIPVLLAPGNHDWLGPASLYRRLDWSDNVHIFDAPRLTAYELVEGFTIWGAAHCAPANTAGFLDDFTVPSGSSGVNIGLFHGSEQADLPGQESGKKPHAPFREQQIPQAGLLHALVGHFHRPRHGPYHTYPGNPDPLSFGEDGERGAVLVSVGQDGSITRDCHRVAVSQVAEVSVDVTGATHSGDVRQRVLTAVSGMAGAVRVTLHGELDPAVDLQVGELAELTTRPVVVARIGALRVVYDFDALAQEQTVRGQFVRDVLASVELTEAQRQRVLITGLRAFDGRAELAG